MNQIDVLVLQKHKENILSHVEVVKKHTSHSLIGKTMYLSWIHRMTTRGYVSLTLVTLTITQSKN